MDAGSNRVDRRWRAKCDSEKFPVLSGTKNRLQIPQDSFTEGQDAHKKNQELYEKGPDVGTLSPLDVAVASLFRSHPPQRSPWFPFYGLVWWDGTRRLGGT